MMFDDKEILKILKEDIYLKTSKGVVKMLIGEDDHRFVDFKLEAVRTITEPQPYSGDEWKEYHEPLKFEDYGKTWSLDKKDLIKGE